MTEPLTPPECDLTDFAFMPLDVARLRDSELASNETPEACWAAVLLWAASWHQVPAASIPNDEKWIAKAAGYAQRGKVAREWVAVREGALRGWVECTDGRLYHSVVAEKAREAWQAKLEQRHRTECARIKKHNDRHEGADVPKPTFEEWMSAGCPVGQLLPVPGDKTKRPSKVPRETTSKGQGEGQRQGQGQQKKNPPSPRKRGSGERFADFWLAWPKNDRKQDKAKCGDHWCLHELDAVADAIVADVRKKRGTPKWAEGFIEAPLTYLRGKRWEDGDGEEAVEEGVANWWDDGKGIRRRGIELGLGDWSETEQFAPYRARVFAKAGPGPWNEKPAGLPGVLKPIAAPEPEGQPQ